MDAYVSEDITSKYLTRRKAVKLVATAVIGASTSLLFGCSLLTDGVRSDLVTKLLKEKYDREFVVVGKPYGFGTSYRPNAYCKEADDTNSPVFEVEFYADHRQSIISDTFIDRKLGRQVEDNITACFFKQGIDVAVIGAIRQSGVDDPDISLDKYLNNPGEKAHFSFRMIIKDDIDARTDERFADALIEAYEKFDPKFWISVFIVKSKDFDEFRDFLREAPELEAKGMPKGKMVGGLLAYAIDSEVTIKDSDTWESSTYK